MKDGGDLALEIQVSLAGLVQVHAAGLLGAQQVETSQGVSGQWLSGETRTLLQEPDTGRQRRCIAGRMKAGAMLGRIWPARGTRQQRQR